MMFMAGNRNELECPQMARRIQRFKQYAPKRNCPKEIVSKINLGIRAGYIERILKYRIAQGYKINNHG